MTQLTQNNPLAVAVTTAIQCGDIKALKQLLNEHPDLVNARIIEREDTGGPSRSLLHAATDWLGHYPNGAATLALLIEAGADVNARMIGPHSETPLHWAASSDDIDVLDALLDAGADIEASKKPKLFGKPLLGKCSPNAFNIYSDWNLV